MSFFSSFLRIIPFIIRVSPSLDQKEGCLSRIIWIIIRERVFFLRKLSVMVCQKDPKRVAAVVQKREPSLLEVTHSATKTKLLSILGFRRTGSPFPPFYNSIERR